MTTKSISFLATGNEIINGEIQDTNSKTFANLIYKHGGNIYQHIHVADKKIEIENALQYLLENSDAVIVTGGLGPTSDDRTRFAIAKVAGKDLIFDNQVWEHIVKRLESFGLQAAECNKQQAFFPENSYKIFNEYGTAYGCHLIIGNKDIFMLPGPPKECLPMFNSYVLPKLFAANFFIKKNTYHWLTMGLVEGEIAEAIDEMVSAINAETGYRWNYPYLEIKVIMEPEENADSVITQINNVLAPYLISKNGKNALELLDNELKKYNSEIVIEDKATENILANEFQKYSLLVFNNKDGRENNTSIFKISCSRIISADTVEYHGVITLSCEGYSSGNLQLKHNMTVPYRNSESIELIKAYFAWQLYKFIKIT